MGALTVSLNHTLYSQQSSLNDPWRSYTQATRSYKRQQKAALAWVWINITLIKSKWEPIPGCLTADDPRTADMDEDEDDDDRPTVQPTKASASRVFIGCFFPGSSFPVVKEGLKHTHTHLHWKNTGSALLNVICNTSLEVGLTVHSTYYS